MSFNIISNNVENYANLASFPATGQDNIIYIDTATNTAYYWNGVDYQSISGGGGGGVNKYVIDLDGSLSNVTFSTAGGKTIIDVVHNLNNDDIVPQIYSNDGGFDEIYYTTMYIMTPNSIKIESAQTISSGDYKLLILY